MDLSEITKSLVGQITVACIEQDERHQIFFNTFPTSKTVDVAINTPGRSPRHLHVSLKSKNAEEQLTKLVNEIKNLPSLTRAC